MARETTSEKDESEQMSRSAQKRQSRAKVELAARLVALTPGVLGRMGLSEDLTRAIAQARDTSANVARQRHIRYVGKLLRGEDTDAIEADLDRDGPGEAAEALVAWRTRLTENGTPAIEDFLAAYPGGDRQQLRQAVRAAAGATPGTPAASRAGRRLLAALRTASRAAAG
jgi:ribosome-associated protein